jgi:hypothetical protein
MRNHGLSEEDRRFHVGVEMSGVYLLGDLVEVGVDSESSTASVKSVKSVNVEEGGSYL